jgi:hypothetical protein
MMVMSTLSVRQCNTRQESEFQSIKPITFCSFGNIDLLKAFQNIINELRLEGSLERKRVKN